MLDEPSLAWRLIVREIFRIVADLKKTGVAVLLVEQNARAALQIADYGYVLETGEVAIEGRRPARGRSQGDRVLLGWAASTDSVSRETRLSRRFPVSRETTGSSLNWAVRRRIIAPLLNFPAVRQRRLLSCYFRLI